MAVNFLKQFGNLRKLSIVDFMHIWNHYDTDGSGFIECYQPDQGEESEFKQFVRDYIHSAMEIDEIDDTLLSSTMRALIAKYDADNNGKFDLSEMIRLLPVEENFLNRYSSQNPWVNGYTSQSIEEILLHYDQDANGRLNGAELDGLVRDIIAAESRDKTGIIEAVTAEEIRERRTEALSIADLDRDGALDRSELKHYLTTGLKTRNKKQ